MRQRWRGRRWEGKFLLAILSVSLLELAGAPHQSGSLDPQVVEGRVCSSRTHFSNEPMLSIAKIYNEIKRQKRHMVSRLACSNNPRCHFDRLVVEDNLYDFLTKMYSGYLAEFSKARGDEVETVKENPWLDFHKFFLCESMLSKPRPSLRNPSEIDEEPWGTELPDFYFDHVHDSRIVPGDVGLKWHVSVGKKQSSSSIKKVRPITVSELVHQGSAFSCSKIEVGDIIECIDDHQVDSSDLARVQNLLNGRNGTKLTIVLRKKKKKSLTLKLLRQWQFCDFYHIVDLQHSVSFPCMACSKNPGPRILSGLSMNGLWALYVKCYQDSKGVKQDSLQDCMSDIDNVRKDFVFLVRDLKFFLESGKISSNIRHMPQALAAYVESNTGKKIPHHDALVPSDSAFQPLHRQTDEDSHESSLNLSESSLGLQNYGPFDRTEYEQYRLGSADSPVYGVQTLADSSETEESSYENLFEDTTNAKWHAMVPTLQKEYDRILAKHTPSAQKEILKNEMMLKNLCLLELEEMDRNWEAVVDDKLLDLREKRKKGPFLTQFGEVKYPDVFWSLESEDQNKEVLFYNEKFLNRTLKRKEEQQRILKKMKYKHEREYLQLRDGTLHDAGPLHHRNSASRLNEAVKYLTMPLDDERILREGLQEYAKVKKSLKKPDLLTYIDDQFLGPADFGSENRSTMVNTLQKLHGQAGVGSLMTAEKEKASVQNSILPITASERRRRERLMDTIFKRKPRKRSEDENLSAEKKKTFAETALEYQVAKLDQLYWSETGQLLEDDLQSSEPDFVMDNVTNTIRHAVNLRRKAKPRKVNPRTKAKRKQMKYQVQVDQLDRLLRTSERD